MRPKLQFSGVSFSRSTCAVSAGDSRMRLPVTNQPALGQPAMGGDEIRPRDAVAVEENAVAAARGEDGAVADLGGAEAAILVPDVIEAMAELSLPALDQRGGRRARAVIGDHHLEIRVGLAAKRAQHRVERVFAIVGGHDDGDQPGQHDLHKTWNGGRPQACRKHHDGFKHFAIYAVH